MATDRPDASDETKFARFASLVCERIAGDTPLDLTTLKGNRPYKKTAGVPLHPRADNKKCNNCGTCAAQCPAGAIDAADPRNTDAKKCIACCRCINVCPQDARSFGGLLYKVAGWKFCKDNYRRLEPKCLSNRAGFHARLSRHPSLYNCRGCVLLPVCRYRSLLLLMYT